MNELLDEVLAEIKDPQADWEAEAIATAERDEERWFAEWSMPDYVWLYEEQDKPIVGYLKIRLKFKGRCEGCGDFIPPKREVWWNPKRKHVIHCGLCTPDECNYEVDEYMNWFDSLTEEEQEEVMGEAEPLSEDDLLDLHLNEAQAAIRKRYSLTAEERVELERAISLYRCGVVAWDRDVEGALEAEKQRDEDGDGESIERLGTNGGEISFSNSFLHSRDELNPRNLTDPAELFTISIEQVFQGLQPVIRSCVNEIGRIQGRERHVHAADLKIIGQTAVWQGMSSFEGRAPFGAFAQVVVQNALRDYVRRELRAAVPSGDLETTTGWTDPTDSWIFWLDLTNPLQACPHGDLVLRHAAGYHDRELGDAPLTCVQRNRAEDKLQLALAA
jgi:hypothetical protein